VGAVGETPGIGIEKRYNGIYYWAKLVVASPKKSTLSDA